MSHNVLVTGALGNLGKKLFPHIIKFYDHVSVLVKDENSISFSNIDSRKVTPCTVSKLKRDKCEFDLIIHLATNYGRNHESEETIRNTNVYLPIDIIEAQKNKQFHFVNFDTPLPSEINFYAKTKEEFRLYLRKKRGLVVSNIFLHNFYGPNMNSIINHVINEIKSGATQLSFTKGQQERDFIFIDDVVDLFLMILLKNSKMCLDYCEFEIGTAKSVSVQFVVKKVKELMGANVNLRFGDVEMRVGEPSFLKADLSWAGEALFDKKFVGLEDGIIRCIKGS